MDKKMEAQLEYEEPFRWVLFIILYRNVPFTKGYKKISNHNLLWADSRTGDSTYIVESFFFWLIYGFQS